ncbi:hypothetical protein HanRHA438_Chr04g0195191 [Helianthus annuus]|nr:hypothetical protein HanLR1_Chr04g0156731 [Helianthus annuus]KAJ0928536.1 hypothetical protein HanRHA438_Chr04g0195191 [Helianthus annuus]
MLKGHDVLTEDKALYESIYSTEVEQFGTWLKNAMGKKVLKDTCLEDGQSKRKELWSEIKSFSRNAILRILTIVMKATCMIPP